MRRPIQLVMLAAALAAAPARAACWNDEDVHTAQLSDMQALLGVMTLRCEAAGHSVRADYDAFVTHGRSAIAMTNQRLKARFWTLYGAQEGQQRLDSFAMALAGSYMEIAAAPENCAQVAALAREAAAADSVAGLIAVAERNNFTPALPEAACRTILASRTGPPSP